MRERTYEHMIEIPLNEYRKLVEELTETRIILANRHEELVVKIVDLKEAHEKLSKLSDLYEQAVVELESYKRLYDMETEGCSCKEEE